MSEAHEAVLKESDVCQWLGVKKQKLRQLCQSAGLPFVRLSSTQRVFLEGSLITWLRSRETRSQTQKRDSE